MKNDKRPSVSNKELFNTNGSLKKSGIELLKKKSRGYVSYVRGENPITFPIRIYPDNEFINDPRCHKNYPKNDIIDFFILPPSKSELKRRLVKRGRDNKKEINLRLSYALNEIKHYNEYKYILVNKNIHKTANEIIKIIDYNLFIDDNSNFLNKNLKKLINFK